MAAAAGKTAAYHGRGLESAFVLAGNNLLQLPSASTAMVVYTPVHPGDAGGLPM